MIVLIIGDTVIPVKSLASTIITIAADHQIDTNSIAVLDRQEFSGKLEVSGTMDITFNEPTLNKEILFSAPPPEIYLPDKPKWSRKHYKNRKNFGYDMQCNPGGTKSKRRNK